MFDVRAVLWETFGNKKYLEKVGTKVKDKTRYIQAIVSSNRI